MEKNEEILVQRLTLIGFSVSLAVLGLLGTIALYQSYESQVMPSTTTAVVLGSVLLVAGLQIQLFIRQRSLVRGRRVQEAQSLRESLQPWLKADALQNAIFNSATFYSIATDMAGVIQHFNVGAERMLGYQAADVINHISPAAISDPDELVARAAALSVAYEVTVQPGFEALVFKASRGIEDIYQLTYIRKDGSRFPAIASVTALRDQANQVIGYLLVGTDNTARKQVDVELENAMAVAEKASQAKSEFLSSMSHELRTPLNAVLGFAQLMASDDPPPSAAQKLAIDQILQAGWYLLRLINEILDLAMIESGKVTMSQESMSLSDVLFDCHAMIEPQATQRGISMSFPNLDHFYYVHADRTRVKQVMINLLSNAIKYNRENGNVTVSCEMVADDRVRVTVRDTGVGLAPDQLAQLFQPFNRLGKESGGQEGTGIGLVVTKQLVELMGGSIRVHSVPGVGSEFCVEFKGAVAPALIFEDGVESSLQAAAVTLTPAKKRRLLYVEDNPANLVLVEQLIARRSDLEMLSATDGVTGVRLARSHLPDLILMDINLPGMSGYDALRILQDDPATAHIPVLALSANAVPRDIERGIDAGFFRYLTKPIKVGEFMSALDTALQSASLQKEPHA